MSQGYTPNYPPTNGAAVSATERANWAAVLSQHAGVSLPSYAVEGTPWWDTASRHLHVAKQYGSKAYGEWAMGPLINLAVALAGAGQDGSTYDALVRVRTNAIMAGVDHDWALNGSPALNLGLDFNHDYEPAYFAARGWSNAAIGEPALWTSDGILLGKGWETIPGGDDEIVYSGSPSPLANVSPFIDTTMRAVDVEEKTVEFDATSSIGQDHVVITPGWPWWQVQDALLSYALVENGLVRSPLTYKVVPFVSAGVVKFVVYNRTANQTLTPFEASYPRALFVTRKV
jgi:hypothetical protein